MVSALKALIEEGSLARPVEPLTTLLRRNCEDVFASPNRMGAADVRARGAAIAEDRLGAGADRVIEVIALVAEIDRAPAAEIFSMTMAACVSALARLKRDLKLKPVELKPVIKCEAAAIERLYPKLTAQLWRAVIDERDRNQWRRKLVAIGRKWLVSDIEKPPAEPALAPARAALSLTRPAALPQPLAADAGPIVEKSPPAAAPAPARARHLPVLSRPSAPIYAPLAEGPAIRSPRSVFSFVERTAAPDFVAALRGSRETIEPPPSAPDPAPVDDPVEISARQDEIRVDAELFAPSKIRPAKTAPRKAFRPLATFAAMRPRESVTAYF